MDRNKYDFFPQVSMSQNYPIVVGIYPASQGTLSLGAFVDSLTGFVKLPPGASVTIDVMADTKGFPFGAYEFIINYVSTTHSVFKIDVNDQSTGVVYSTEATKSLNSKDSKNLKIILKLTSGKNKIKFYSYAKNYSPDLGNITVNIVSNTFPAIQPTPMPPEIGPVPIYPPPPSTSPINPANIIGVYTPRNAILGNGATLITSTGFIGWLGGPKDGFATIDVIVNKAGLYEFLIKYISSENRGFKVDINNKPSIIIYKPLKTNGWSLRDLKIYSLKLQLNTGLNKIKIHGDGKNFTPDIGEITIKEISSNTPSIDPYPAMPNPSTPNINSTLSFNAGKELLSNGAKLDQQTNFATLIGGLNDGSVTIIADINNSARYNVNIEYIAADTQRPLAIDINNKLTDIFRFPVTKGWSLSDAKTFMISLYLTAGKNKIVFHGNKKEYAPNIGMITISKPQIMSTGKGTILTAYDVSLGSLNNGASIDTNTNFAINIGGLNEGYSSVLVNVDKLDLYTLSLKYLSGDKPRHLNIQINEDKNTMAYTLSPTKSWNLEDVGIFKSNVLLKKGENKIKFYGDLIDYAPNLGEFTIEPFENKVSSSITLVGSAVIKENLIDGISNNEGGEVILSIVIPTKGIYDFAVHYVADDNKKIKIDVNGVNTGIIYTFDKTVSLDISDEKIRILQLPLIKGENTIRIYN